MQNAPRAESPGTAEPAARIDAAGLKRRIDAGERLTLVDVRSAVDHGAARLHGSINVPLETLRSAAGSIPSQNPIVVVCQTGTRAALAAPALRERGAVLVLDGGLDAWRKCGFGVEGRGVGVWPLERQVRLAAGALVLLGTLLAVAVHPGFVGIAIFVGAGLVVSGLTGFCGMALLLAKLPWNRRAFGAAAPGESPPSSGGECSSGSGGACAG